jgi:CheY-like chemotaxis protein
MLALLADRDAETRTMYAQYLRLGLWSTDEAADGREALAKALTRCPDIVVTETRLPGISGYDLCQLLRRDSLTQSTPIVVVTGDAFTRDVERVKRAGATSVLIKPCLPETLAVELCRLINLSRACLHGGTTNPPIPAPGLLCPHCHRPLTFEKSHVGGASAKQQEQWDYFTCPAGCGMFQYRRRTRRIRQV